ncbi:MAG: hemolysin family protein [Candidatus Nanoarchaeia archaeon]
MPTGTEIVLLIVLIALSGYFSGVETAFVSLDRVRLRKMQENDKKNAEFIVHLKEDPHRLLSTLLIGNNIVNVGASAIATSIAMGIFGNIGVGIATGFMTLVILIFGEITPKSIAIAKAETICSFSAKSIYYFGVVLKPLLWFSDKLTKGIARAFGSEQSTPLITEEEIRSFVNIGEEIGSIEKDEKEMINNIFKMNDMQTKDIMVPKIKVGRIKAEKKIKDIINEVIRSGYSRLPVYEKDKVLGILYTKDILKEFSRENTEKKAKEITRECFFVPETKRVDMLLQDFQKKKLHIAIVINEYGDFVGLVTLEDVLEEIVGEIYDETDKIDESIKKIDNNTYDIKGETSLEDIKKITGTRIKSKSDISTLAGYILDKKGSIPEKGEEIKKKKFNLKVINIKDNRILKVRLILKE